MLTDYDIAVAVQALYDAPDKSFDKITDEFGIFFGIKYYDDCSLIVFRGSYTVQDWFDDFQGLMVHDPEIGGVEGGFWSRMRLLFTLSCIDFLEKETKPLYIAGHSLGAARALVFAAFWQLRHQNIEAVVTFGSPRPGGQKIKDILAPVAIRSYRNGHDPVCGVPFTIPDIEPYLHPRDLIAVDVPPPVNDPWGVIARHHSQLYLEAMKGLQDGQSNPSV